MKKFFRLLFYIICDIKKLSEALNVAKDKKDFDDFLLKKVFK